MWLFTKYGFLSVVRSGEDNSIMVRARDRNHLVRLQASKPDVLKGKKILASPDSDYGFRTILSWEEWLALAVDLAGDIDYSNFKEEVGKQNIKGPYLATLHRVWQLVGNMLQKDWIFSQRE